MRNLFKLTALALTLVMLLTTMFACAVTPTVDVIKERGTIIMLTNAGFPPFEYPLSGSVAGVDVDIATEIAKELGVTLEIQDMAFEGIVNAVKSGKGDMGVAGMSITEDRQKNVDFSIEYVASKLVILVRIDEAEITANDHLKGQTIAVQTGTTSDIFASDIEGATLSRFGTFLDAATALKSGKVRAVVVDEMTSNEILDKNPDLKKLDEPLTEERYAICVQKDNKTLLDAINAVLTRLLDEGKIDEFIYNHTSGEKAG